MRSFFPLRIDIRNTPGHHGHMSDSLIDYSSVRVAGHAFRKVAGPLSTYRGFVPTCECGFQPFTYTTRLKHARYLHGEHKRRVLAGTE